MYYPNDFINNWAEAMHLPKFIIRVSVHFQYPVFTGSLIIFR